MTVLVPDFGAGRPGAGLGPGINFTANENVLGRLILAEMACPNTIHTVAILEKTRNRSGVVFRQIRRQNVLATDSGFSRIPAPAWLGSRAHRLGKLTIHVRHGVGCISGTLHHPTSLWGWFFGNPKPKRFGSGFWFFGVPASRVTRTVHLSSRNPHTRRLSSRGVDGWTVETPIFPAGCHLCPFGSGFLWFRISKSSRTPR